MTEHTLKFYGEELDQLKAEVARLGGLAEAQLADAIEATANRDVGLAQALIQRDQKLDALQKEIERKAVRMVALRQPVAHDLRRTVAALKMSWQLERAGDQAKSIAKRLLTIAQAEPVIPSTRSVERMGRLVAIRLKEVLDAYATGDLARAERVWRDDQEVDEHYNSVFRELLTYMMGDPRVIGACTQLLFIAKNLERIGDYATNLAELVQYELTGEDFEGDRPKWVESRETSAEGEA
jgi:phosphate transport system protein